VRASRLPIALALLLLLAISVIPIGRTMLTSLRTTEAPGAAVEFTTQNYTRAFLTEGEEDAADGGSAIDTINVKLLGNSLAIATLAALLAIALGVPYALLVTRTDIPLRGFFTAIYLVPLVLPPLLTGLAWTFIPAFEPPPLTEQNAADPGSGALAVILRAAALFGACYFPLVVLFARRALRQVPASLEESAVVAGGPWRALRSITLPLILPSVLAAALFVFLFALNDFSLVDYLNWVRPTAQRVSVYPFRAFTAWRDSTGEGVAVALGMPLAVLGAILLAVIHRLVGRRVRATVSGTFREPRRFELGRWKGPAVGALLLLVLVTVGIPLYGLLQKAGGIASYRAIWKTVMGPLSSTDDLPWTLYHATLAALIAVPLAFVLAHRVARRGSTWISALTLLPLALPPIFLGIGYLRVFGGLDFSIPGVVENRNPFTDLDGPRFGSALLLVAKYLPFALAALWASLLEIDPRLEEAAATAGVRPLDRALGILLPLAKHGLGLAFVLVFVFSLREIDTLVLLDGASVLRKIYTAVHFTRDSQVAALCVILIVLQAIPFAWL